MFNVAASLDLFKSKIKVLKMRKFKLIPALLLPLLKGKCSLDLSYRIISRNLYTIRASFSGKHSLPFVNSFLPHTILRTSNVTLHQQLNTSKYSTLPPSNKTGIQKNIPTLQAKKRVPRKKGVSGPKEDDKDKFLVVAYSSSEEYDIPAIACQLEKQGVYNRTALPEDVENVLHVKANYQFDKEPRHVYFFSEGSVVFWNVPELEQKSILTFLKPYQVHSYDENLVLEEKEDLEYLYSVGATKLAKGQICLEQDKDFQLETYTFSNALALSVKLALWEASLESFIDSIEWVTENMRDGKKVIMSREEVFRKRGELFALRHVINLSSDLLDTPDFYWDRQKLENLYQQTYNYLNISKRTKVMNERLSYCSELIDLLSNHMNDKHHVRLELMIIALIMVEVMFECIHFIERVI